MARANGGLSNHVEDACWSRADCSTLIKAQFSALNVATERGTSDKTEATRFSQCAHDQHRRLEAEDCDSIRYTQFISGGRRRIRPPHCLAHARPTMCCIRVVTCTCIHRPKTGGSAYILYSTPFSRVLFLDRQTYIPVQGRLYIIHVTALAQPHSRHKEKLVISLQTQPT